MKNQRMRILPFIMVLVLGGFLLTGCSIFSDDWADDLLVGTQPSNSITQEITQKVVEYKTMSVEDFQTAVQEAYKKVKNSVIGVTCKAIMPSTVSGTTDHSNSLGSGVIYKREAVIDNNVVKAYKYYVLTNRHVIDGSEVDGALGYNIYAYLGNEDKEIKATVLGSDSKVDIAVITFEHTTLFEPVVIADSDEIESGSFAIAVGNPDGYDYYNSVTFGVISGPLRYFDTDTDDDGTSDFSATYIQHDVAINPGNSGGGLFNIYGELLGINTLKLVSSDIDNMGFAIPSNVAYTIANDYIEKDREIVRARLGILGTEVRALSDYQIEQDEDIKSIPDIYEGETRYGIYVIEVNDATLKGTGVQPHDIILSVGGVKITRTHIISARLNSLVDFQVGDVVDIVYYSRSLDKVVTIQAALKA